MACFTTEHVLQIALYSKSCKVGDDIWMMGETDEYNDVMRRFNAKTKTCENIVFNKTSSDPFWNEARVIRVYAKRYSIFTSDGQLYMCSRTGEGNCRLLKFDTRKLEWKQLMDFEADGNNRVFVMIGSKLYMTPGYQFMQIVDLDTAQTTSVDFPRSNAHHDHDHCNICKMNGMIYLIATRRPYWRSVYQYDKDGDQFVNIKKKDRMLWAVEQYGNHLPHMDTFAWSSNNKIFQAFVVDENFSGTIGQYLVIDYFDVETEHWHTVFQSIYDKGVKNIHGDSDNIYVVSEDTAYVDIREIDLDPNLQNISLIQLADTNVANYYTENYVSMTTKLPIGLRDTYDNMITWKVQETRLGQLEHICKLIEKWDVDMRKIAEKGAHVTSEEQIEKLKHKWDDIDNAQGIESRKFIELKKEYELMVELQRKYLVDEQVLRQVEYRSGRFEELCQRFDNCLEVLRKKERKFPLLQFDTFPQEESELSLSLRQSMYFS